MGVEEAKDESSLGLMLRDGLTYSGEGALGGQLRGRSPRSRPKSGWQRGMSGSGRDFEGGVTEAKGYSGNNVVEIQMSGASPSGPPGPSGSSAERSGPRQGPGRGREVNTRVEDVSLVGVPIRVTRFEKASLESPRTGFTPTVSNFSWDHGYDAGFESAAGGSGGGGGVYGHDRDADIGVLQPSRPPPSRPPPSRPPPSRPPPSRTFPSSAPSQGPPQSVGSTPQSPRLAITSPRPLPQTLPPSATAPQTAPPRPHEPPPAASEASHAPPARLPASAAAVVSSGREGGRAAVPQPTRSASRGGAGASSTASSRTRAFRRKGGMAGTAISSGVERSAKASKGGDSESEGSGSGSGGD